MSSTHVLIASVPERQDNLHALLADISQQTRPPDHVCVYLNGYSTPLSIPGVHINWSPTRRAAGARWQYVEDIPVTDDAWVYVIDDDFRLQPTYLEETAKSLTDGVGMVTWTGHTRLSKYHFLTPSATSLPLVIGGSGTSLIRAQCLYGITRHRLSTELLSSGGDDELLVSILMHERHWSIVRPAGQPPLTSVDSLQEAPTASHCQHAIRWQFRRKQLAQEYGWS